MQQVVVILIRGIFVAESRHLGSFNIFSAFILFPFIWFCQKQNVTVCRLISYSLYCK